MALSPQWLDELRARITLSGLISRDVRLVKAGHEFKACCPFHNEKSPSFTVNDQKGFYHCFGCGAHGDAIRWMTDHRGMAFMDAVKELAAQAGMDVPAPDPRSAQKAQQHAGLHEVMEAAQNWFRAQLETADGGKARAYLKSRRFDAHTMERFGFGFAPAGRQALKAALSQFDEAMLIEAGLRIAVDEREPYDRFRDRLTIPIHDARGRVIGFAARILDAEKKDAPKYLNSPDTPLFDKGRTLFNLHRAGPASRQSGRIVVVEGQMDVIALSAAGIADAVAPMGTALTERQLEMLWRLTETPVLCFDGDAAGQRAAMRAITRALPMLRPAHSLKVAHLPAGTDPDDLIKRDGPEGFYSEINHAESMLDALWRYERDAQPLTTPEDKAGLKARLLSHVETIEDTDIRSLYRRDLLKKFSEFAFPPRDYVSQGNVIDIRGARRWGATQRRIPWEQPDSNAPSHPASRAYQKKVRNPEAHKKYLHRRLGAAIAEGLYRFPEYAMIYAESLLKVSDVDNRIEAIINGAFEYETLDPSIVDTILAEGNLFRPHPREWDELRFTFTFPPSNAAEAAEALELAMKLYVGSSQLDQALAAATLRFAADMTEENFIEQKRILERAMAFRRDLMQMAAA